ncbi:response regulator [Priestia filamentosa]|uniref:response regulator n=1 Tax=Priestia filamentosa TaxID=1402861 RepID=UPI001FB30E2F|nr:response regulator [Priestia filamentosa]MED3724741.1 response regulator [Priestia filamentosa]UOE60922.1 response regulator [Priestia filamentosa]
MIRVLIVEDDPMVAEFNKRYLEEIEGFELAGVAYSVDEALGKLQDTVVDLILLDVFMPERTGLELLDEIRKQHKKIDVILITAASEVDKVQTALRYGAVDYLIKPFEFDRFNRALVSYREKRAFFDMQTNVKQEDLDQNILSRTQKTVTESLPKGLTKSTLKILLAAIENMEKDPFSTDDVAEDVGISRVSVRKYLRFLTDIHVLEEKMTYGTVGRPVYLYHFNEKNRSLVKNYL